MGWFSHEGYRIGGPLLGGALAIGGAVMSFAVFEAAMLWVSRMPFVLARESYLPPAFGEILEATATPWKSIVWCCAVFTLLVPLGFLALVVLDVFFYMAALVLEMIALLKLRRLRPRREGLFVVGGGKLGLVLIATLPLHHMDRDLRPGDLAGRGAYRLSNRDRIGGDGVSGLCVRAAAMGRSQGASQRGVRWYRSKDPM